MTPHGTPSRYSNTPHCRCDPCRWAWASYQRGERPAVAEPVWLDGWLASAANSVTLGGTRTETA